MQKLQRISSFPLLTHLTNTLHRLLPFSYFKNYNENFWNGIFLAIDKNEFKNVTKWLTHKKRSKKILESTEGGLKALAQSLCIFIQIYFPPDSVSNVLLDCKEIGLLLNCMVHLDTLGTLIMSKNVLRSFAFFKEAILPIC